MVAQAEIKKKAEEWEVPATTVEKDHALGHFLAGFTGTFKNRLRFKGGTCLRKCYFPEYRFSEDLDFSSVAPEFILQAEELVFVCETVEKYSGIMFRPEPIEPLLHKDKRKGDKVIIRFWGANHSRHEAPPPYERWHSKIKVEISTDELLILQPELKTILHPYSDKVLDLEPISCYTIDEVIAEKLRSLVQRSYSAPRDYYDLYYLTSSFTREDWNRIKPIFIAKMTHKDLDFQGPQQLVSPSAIEKVHRAWHKSIAHQVNTDSDASAAQMIEEVSRRIMQYL
jgi:predicted nucleotidyltransferase component of viral defense system